MHRVGNLFDELVSWGNLSHAFRQAARGKRSRRNVAEFWFDYERELLRLQEELIHGQYVCGAYRTFHIREPKLRLISAAPFRDRVVHHALCNVIEPIFESRFIHDSYACRRGKGSHAAVARAQRFSRRWRYCLQGDVSKFFPSLDHEILKQRIRRKIKDPRVLDLVDRIIDSSNAQEPVLKWFAGDDLLAPVERRRGLPIGNQTSQFFANVYLDGLDHFVKEGLGFRGYVRYVDDFLVFSSDKQQLAAARDAIRRYLASLRLELHPRKSVIFPCAQGFRFLGYRAFPTHRRLSKENVKRFRKRMMAMQRQVESGQLKLPEVRQRIVSWIAHARHADTYGLRERVFSEFAFHANLQTGVRNDQCEDP